MSDLSAVQMLPFELIALILEYLDQPSPMGRRMFDNPAKILDDDIASPLPFTIPPPPNTSSSSSTTTTTSTSTAYTFYDPNAKYANSKDLKCVSLVSRKWRACVLPFLFRHVQWKFQSFQRPPPDQEQNALNHVDQFAWLRFLIRHELTHYVKTLTIIIRYPSSKIGEDLTHHHEFGILPSHLVAPKRRNQPIPANRGNNWLWRTIFDHVDPLTVTLMSSPAILASLLGRPIDLSGAWLFHQRFHILSLSRSPTSHVTPVQDPPVTPASPTNPQNIPCDLFSIRHWTSLLINEGSSVRAYATYQYYSHTPPSLLPAILDSSDPSMSRLLNSVTSLSYVAIFPFSTHIASNLVPRVPSLHRFFIQIVPRDLNFAEEPYRRPAIDINDFWVERNSAYSHLAMAVFDTQPSGAWNDLQVFESGDSADLEAWETAVQFVIFNAGTKWQVSSNGVFTRRDHEIPDQPVSGSLAMAMSAMAFNDDQ